MERLSGLDAGFLYMETPTLMMHTVEILVLTPRSPRAEAPDGFYHWLAARLHLVPPLRRRLLPVPLGLHHPVWIEDPHFDLSHHLKRHTLAAPGSLAQLDAFVSQIAEQHLDRQRPLWEIWMIDGLEDGAIAVVPKIHHAAADGIAVTRLLMNILTPEVGGAIGPEMSAWQSEEMPSDRTLIQHAVRDRLSRYRLLPKLVSKTLHNGWNLIQDQRRQLRAAPLPLIGTRRTSFNHALGAERVVATTVIPIERVQAVKAHFGVKLNDVALCLVAGALRRYLTERNELPHKALVASAPVCTDPESVRLAGNHLSNLIVGLPVQIEDPEERLRATHEAATEAKRAHVLLGPELMREWAEFTPLNLYGWFLRQWSRFDLANVFPPTVNLVVSNIPGPTRPLFASSYRLRSMFLIGPVLEGIALNVTLWSYDGNLHFALNACRSAVPEPQRIVAGLEAALAELYDQIPLRDRARPSTTIH